MSKAVIFDAAKVCKNLKSLQVNQNHPTRQKSLKSNKNPASPSYIKT